MATGPEAIALTDVLGIIDVQPTFMPGGELPVPGGDEVVPVINQLLRNRFRDAFATQDWHPRNHTSFASQHPGHSPYDVIALPYGAQVLWPDHALQGTPNAALHSGLDTDRISLILRKGWRPELDSYSAFFENDRTTRTGLAGWLTDRGARRLFLTGLAADFCVAWSAEDAVRAGFETIIIEDATRAIALPQPDGATSATAARSRLEDLGVRFLPAAALLS